MIYVQLNNPNDYSMCSKPKSIKQQLPFVCNCYQKQQNCTYVTCINAQYSWSCSKKNCSQEDEKLCNNRQREVIKGLYLKDIPGKGKGVFCQYPINKNDFIIEYTGQILHCNHNEFKMREQIYSLTTHTYEYQLKDGYVIDATQYGNWGRYINHSHQPNCKPKLYYKDGIPHIYIFAKRNIQDGEELTYEYGLNITHGQKLIKCLCQSSKCTGYMGISKKKQTHYLLKQNIDKQEFERQQKDMPFKKLQRCGKCQQVGHNQKSCSKFGYYQQPKPKRKQKRDKEKVKQYNQNHQNKLKKNNRPRDRKVYQIVYRTLQKLLKEVEQQVNNDLQIQERKEVDKLLTRTSEKKSNDKIFILSKRKASSLFNCKDKGTKKIKHEIKYSRIKKAKPISLNQKGISEKQYSQREQYLQQQNKIKINQDQQLKEIRRIILKPQPQKLPKFHQSKLNSYFNKRFNQDI